jgi:hypothetical protein
LLLCIFFCVGNQQATLLTSTVSKGIQNFCMGRNMFKPIARFVESISYLILPTVANTIDSM